MTPGAPSDAHDNPRRGMRGAQTRIRVCYSNSACFVNTVTLNMHVFMHVIYRVALSQAEYEIRIAVAGLQEYVNTHSPRRKDDNLTQIDTMEMTWACRNDIGGLTRGERHAEYVSGTRNGKRTTRAAQSGPHRGPRDPHRKHTDNGHVHGRQYQWDWEREYTDMDEQSRSPASLRDAGFAAALS